MGGHVTRNLLKAGYRVLAFDLAEDRLEGCVRAGAVAARDATQVVQDGDVVLTSLPSSQSFVAVADEIMVPNARIGQVFVDIGTVTPPETRRLATALERKGAALVDAPVSGGPAGAERGSLLVFAGGDVAAVERCRPILDILGGNGGRITYCGPAGCGQVVKGVNQLAMGLGNAAFLESVAFGVNAGVPAEVIAEAVGGDSGWRAIVRGIAGRVADGRGNEVGVKFRELPYFIREAKAAGFPLPLTELLYAFCDKGDRVVVDDNRPAPAFFRELTSERPAP
jgi:2-hydroxy-3-oxopropionate reductase